MISAQRVPPAQDVMRSIPAVRETDPVVKPLHVLREYGVAVLVDADYRPFDLLTAADVDRVKERAAKLSSSSQARELFAPERPFMLVVKTQDDLAAVTRMMAANKLPGVVVVDESGRYAGYIFSEDLRQRAESFVQEAVQRAEWAQRAFPEAWSATGAPAPSSVKR